MLVPMVLAGMGGAAPVRSGPPATRPALHHPDATSILPTSCPARRVRPTAGPHILNSRPCGTGRFLGGGSGGGSSATACASATSLGAARPLAAGSHSVNLVPAPAPRLLGGGSGGGRSSAACASDTSLGATRLPALGSGGGFGVEGAGPCGGDGERGGAGGGGQGCGSSGGGEADGGDGRGGSRWGVSPASCSPVLGVLHTTAAAAVSSLSRSSLNGDASSRAGCAPSALPLGVRSTSVTRSPDDLRLNQPSFVRTLSVPCTYMHAVIRRTSRSRTMPSPRCKRRGATLSARSSRPAPSLL